MRSDLAAEQRAMVARVKARARAESIAKAEAERFPRRESRIALTAFAKAEVEVGQAVIARQTERLHRIEAKRLAKAEAHEAKRLAKAEARAKKIAKRLSRSAVARSLGVPVGTLWARQQSGLEASPRTKSRARRAVQNALANGKLIKTPCIVCGNPKSEGHHPNYRRRLWVFWLCRAHHKQLHSGTLSAEDSAKIPAQAETPTGPARARTKLTVEQVLSIRQGLVEGISMNKLSKIHGVAHGTIDGIAKGRTWQHLAKEEQWNTYQENKLPSVLLQL